MSDSLWPHGLQHARLSSPSLSTGVCWNSYPLSQWCHPTITLSVTHFCPQSFSASGSFPMSLVFATGGQSIGASTSVSPSNEYSRMISFRIDWFDLLAVQGTLKSLLQHYISKESIPRHSAFFIVQLLHPYMTNGKTLRIFVSKLMSLLFKCAVLDLSQLFFQGADILTSWLQSPSTVILEPEKLKAVTVSIFFPIYLPWSDGTRCHDLSFLNVEF